LNQAFANNTTGGTLYSQNQTSTADILYNQLTTDPLAAPLSDASTLAVNSVGDVQSFLSKGLSSLIQNPLTLALTVVVIAGVVVAVIGLPASKKLVGLK
jgi:hypothetical protein